MGALDSLFSSLYSLVREESHTRRKEKRTKAGHLFEDVTAQKIYLQARSLGLSPNPPRYTLPYPTFSGNLYQFDASFAFQNSVYIVECKRTKIPAKNHIHYFNSQIVDYLLGARMRGEPLLMKGIFLSTVGVKNNAMIYALAYGISVIDPESPPIEYILSTLHKDSKLYGVAKRFYSELRRSVDVFSADKLASRTAKDLCKEYRFLCKRWREQCEALTNAKG